MKYIRMILAAVLAVSCCAMFASCDKNSASSVDPTATVGTVTSVTATHYAAIDIQNYGTIVVALDEVTAPITTKNFISLAEDGFYDGLSFHRIMEGFMMQGGDPLGNGTGGSNNEIKGEFASNGIENPLSHVRGAISMARNSYSMDSASSQFFIVHEDSTFLDGEYAVFGYVVEGIEVVDAICTSAHPTDSNGSIAVSQQPIINSITIHSEAPAVDNGTITTAPNPYNTVGTVTSVTATHYADIVIENYGTVTLALDAKTAPITTQNFVSLAQSGFYNGLTFHRIMEGFMMQGGDPSGNGTGGSSQTITGEFAANGIENPLSHVRGAISMARGSYSMDSASSQFFIVHKDSTFLDGNYAVFGYVVSGIEVVDAVCTTAEPTDDNGTIPAAEQPIIQSVTVREA